MPAPGSATLATCTDSAQPISNGLYASLGIAPRMPLARLVGLPEREGHLPPLPRGIRAIQFDELDGAAAAHLDDEVTAIDRATAGFEHLVDHAFVRAEGRVGILFVDGSGRSVGYGYASEAGRVGPVAVLDPALLASGDRPRHHDDRPARRVRALDAGRRRRSDDCAAPRGLQDGRVPVPRLLGSADHRFLALRADFAGAALKSDATSTDRMGGGYF